METDVKFMSFGRDVKVKNLGSEPMMVLQASDGDVRIRKL